MEVRSERGQEGGERDIRGVGDYKGMGKREGVGRAEAKRGGGEWGEKLKGEGGLGGKAEAELGGADVDGGDVTGGVGVGTRRGGLRGWKDE